MAAPIPNIISGQAIGSTITVQNSTDLALLSTQGITIGSQVYNVAVGAYFALTVSSAGLVTDQIVAAEGLTGWRWIKVVTGAGTGQFPIIVNGGTVAINPWQNVFTVYASPTGDDSKAGDSWATAVQYLSTAYGKVLAAGGGEVHYSQGTYSWPVSGQFPSGQGLWLRDDGVPVPGFLPSCPVRFVGYGDAFAPFGYTGCGGLIGGATYTQGRFNPNLWICASQSKVISFDNVGFGAAPGNPNSLGSASNVIRVGWDYQRSSDYTPKFQNISSWARVTSGSPPGVATLAVTASTYPVVSMSRASGIVTVNFTNTDPIPCWQGGSPGTVFDIAGTPGSFPAGTFTITTVVSGTSFQYAQAGADVPLAAATGTITSTSVKANDRIEVVSTSSEVFTTMYKVTSVPNGHTLVVTDYYGQSPRTPTITVANPGKLVLQDRSFRQSVAVTSFVRCQALQLNVPDSGELGPTIDVGSMTDGRLVFRETCFGGGGPSTGPGVNVLDPDRAAWLLSDGGGNTGGNSFFIKHARPVGGGIRVWTDGTAVDVDDIQADIGVPDVPPPIVEFCGTVPQPHSTLTATRSFQTDKANPLDPDFVCNLLLPANVYVMDAEVVTGPGTVVSGETAAGWANNRTKSPLNQSQAGFWADRRLAGQHPGNYRALGPLQSARYPNLVTQNPSGWTHVGTAITTGQADPFGGTAAIKFTGSGGLAVTLATSDNATRTVGDRWAFGCWVRGNTSLLGNNTVNGSLVLSYDHGASNGPFTSYDDNQITATTPFTFAKNVPFLGDGEWQWCVCSGTLNLVNNSAAASNVLVQYTTAMTIYRPTLVKVPVGDMTDNEFAEYVLTLRHQSDYLPAHMAGTDNGIKLVGHGGLGTAARYTVGGASGQITIGAAAVQAIEVFDESGNSLGVLRPSAFTVN